MSPKWLIAFASLAAATVLAPSSGSTPLETRLLFASNRTGVWQIYSVRRSGGGLVQLTFGAVGSRAPRPSPDGRRVLFARGADLWIMRANGLGARRLLRTVGSNVTQWAPDSRRFALGNVIVDATTARTRRLNVAGVPIGWSRDARTVFLSQAPICGASCGVVSADVRGGAARQIVAPAAAPQLSRDGRWIAFFRPDGALWRATAAGAVDRLPLATAATAPLHWSPNGSRIAFGHPLTRDAFNVIVGGVDVVDVARRQTQRLVDDPYLQREPRNSAAEWPAPAWTPTGDGIAYVVNAGIRLRRRDGTIATVFASRAEGADVADLSWTRSPAITSGRSAQRVQPLYETDPTEVRFRGAPVDAIAADGDRVAFVQCNNLGAWRPGSAPEWTGPSSCPHVASLWTLGSVAFSAQGIAAVGWTGGGNTQQFQLGVARSGSPISESVAHGVVCCTGTQRRGAELGALLGAGTLLAFSRWTVSCPSFTDPACAVSAGAQGVWRVREPSWPGTCPAGVPPLTRPGPCVELASSRGPLAPLAIDAEHVVLVREGGAVVVVDGEGTTVQTLGFAPGEVTAAAIDGDDLVVAVPGLLLEYSVGSGTLRRSLPLPTVSSGGFCASPVSFQCAPPQLRLEALRNRRVAFLADGQLHLLSLDDGRDAVVGPATAAQFGDGGLFYAFSGAAPWPGRIRFVPFDRLP